MGPFELPGGFGNSLDDVIYFRWYERIGRDYSEFFRAIKIGIFQNILRTFKIRIFQFLAPSVLGFSQFLFEIIRNIRDGPSHRSISSPTHLSGADIIRGIQGVQFNIVLLVFYFSSFHRRMIHTFPQQQIGKDISSTSTGY